MYTEEILGGVQPPLLNTPLVTPCNQTCFKKNKYNGLGKDKRGRI